MKPQDIITTLVTELGKSGLVAYDQEPPDDQPSPWIVLTSDTSPEEYINNEHGLSGNITVMIVMRRDLGLALLREMSQTIYNLLHKKRFPVDASDFYIRCMNITPTVITRWNLVTQTYLVLGD